MFDLVVSCLVLTALLAYVNYRFVRWPPMIGVMALALVLSLVLAGLERLGVTTLSEYETHLLSSLDFPRLLMQGMLSMLLFASALNVDVAALRRYGWQIGILALLGTAASMLLIGYSLWAVLPLLHHPLPLSYCLLFGALISPTDPIAVMGILQSARAPKNLEVVIAGESLFNDGIGVVLFSLVMTLVAGGTPPTFQQGARLLLQQAGGGIGFGLVLGYVTFLLLKSIDNYRVEVQITLAAVLGGYALADRMHVSGPLAMVVTGLMIGSQGRAYAMSERTRERLDNFWELLDEILNAVLFVLIGLEVTLIPFSGPYVAAGIAAIVIALLARWLSVGVPAGLLRETFRLPPGSWLVLTWGGLRGGISVALALSLPAGAEHDGLLALTYSVVVFSVLCQGLSMRAVTRRAVPCEE